MLINQITNIFESNKDLKVLFLFDPECQFEEEFANLDLENIRCVKVESNYFYIKHQIYTEWSNEKLFLYLNIPSPHKSGKYLQFPLLDLLEANKEIVTDDEELFLEEYGLARSQKNLIRKYMRELKYTSVQEVCKPILVADKLDETTLQQGLISAFLKLNKVSSWPNVIGKLLLLSKPDKETEFKRFLKKLKENDLEPVLMKKLKVILGVKDSLLSQELLMVVLQKIRYNQITFWIAEAAKDDPYSNLKIKEKTILTYINQILQESAQHPQINGKLKETLDWAGEGILGEKLIQVYGTEVEYGMLTDSMGWTLLIDLLDIIDYNPANFVKKLESLLLNHEVSDNLNKAIGFMIHLAQMIAQINEVSNYTLNTPDEYINKYTSVWHSIDRSYRKAINKYKQIGTVPESLDLDNLYALLNKRYDTFTERVNREWLKCFSEFKFDYNSLKTVKQYDFYKREIEESTVKTVVVISDALRYEAAEQLIGMMHGDDKNVAEISHQLASIPSKTSVGMAQLLPGQSKQFNKGRITINGISMEGIQNRQSILQTVESKALAVQFSAVENMPLKDSREIFKAPLVYVYHDVIDSTGDKRPSERRTFKAVDEALEELSKFANKLHHTYNVTRVFITSDHGFLYNDLEIEEKDKEPGFGDDALDSHNRYEIITSSIKPKLGYCIPLQSTTIFKDVDDLFILTPESTNRYKKQGVGHQFVHGGGALQELIVPVINSYRKTQSIAKKVKPLITNEAQLKIVSNILRLKILQEKKISRTEKELVLSIGLYKDYDLVSNEFILELNSTSESPSERMHQLELVVNSNAASESFLKLKLFDVDEKLNPLIEIRVSNQTLIQPDF